MIDKETNPSGIKHETLAPGHLMTARTAMNR